METQGQGRGVLQRGDAVPRGEDQGPERARHRTGETEQKEARYQELQDKGNAKTGDELLEFNRLRGEVDEAKQSVSDLSDAADTAGRSWELSSRQAAIAVSDLSDDVKDAANAIADSVDAMGQGVSAALQGAGVERRRPIDKLAQAGVSSPRCPDRQRRVREDGAELRRVHRHARLDDQELQQHARRRQVRQRHRQRRPARRPPGASSSEREHVVYKDTGVSVEDGELAGRARERLHMERQPAQAEGRHGAGRRKRPGRQRRAGRRGHERRRPGHERPERHRQRDRQRGRRKRRARRRACATGSTSCRHAGPSTSRRTTQRTAPPRTPAARSSPTQWGPCSRR